LLYLLHEFYRRSFSNRSYTCKNVYYVAQKRSGMGTTDLYSAQTFKSGRYGCTVLAAHFIFAAYDRQRLYIRSEFDYSVTANVEWHTLFYLKCMSVFYIRVKVWTSVIYEILFISTTNPWNFYDTTFLHTLLWRKIKRYRTFQKRLLFLNCLKKEPRHFVINLFRKFLFHKTFCFFVTMSIFQLNCIFHTLWYGWN